ncbi:MAG: hypothetical protein RL272_208 [Candidatus Parcubacteria bacterium]|jgi:hypothetical protein
MRFVSLMLVACVSLAAGWMLGTVLPWWGTLLLVVAALAVVRLRAAGRS